MKKCCIFCPEWNIFQKIQWFRTPQFISYKQCNFRENRTTFIFWFFEGAANIKFTMVACRISSVLNLRQITLLLFILAGWWNTLSLEKISAGKDDKQSHRCSRKTFRIYRAHPDWHCMYSVHCTNTNAFFTLVQKSSSFSLQKYTYLTTKSCISLKNYFLQFMFNHYSSTVHRYSHDNCAKIKHNNMKIVEKLQKSHFYIVRGPNKWFP